MFSSDWMSPMMPCAFVFYASPRVAARTERMEMFQRKEFTSSFSAMLWSHALQMAFSTAGV